MRRAALLLLLTLAAAPAALAAQAPVSARLRIEGARDDAVAIVQLEVERGWKLYARDPGEAGLPLRVEWFLPDGWTADAPVWPEAEPTEVFGVLANVHEGRLRITRNLRPPELFVPRVHSRELAVRIRWGACREVCVPGDTVLHARLPVGR